MFTSDDDLVSELMSTPVVAIEPKSLVSDVMRLSENLAIHHFPIVDGDFLFGVICTCDLISAEPEQPILQFVRRPAVTVKPESSAAEAATLMLTRGVGSIVVADEAGVWGILTREDLAETMPELMRETLCSCCQTRQHLRHDLSGGFICLACATRKACEGPD